MLYVGYQYSYLKRLLKIKKHRNSDCSSKKTNNFKHNVVFVGKVTAKKLFLFKVCFLLSSFNEEIKMQNRYIAS